MKLRFQYTFKSVLVLFATLVFIESKGSEIIFSDSTELNTTPPADTITTPFIKNLELFIDYGKLLTLPFDFEKKGLLGAGIYFKGNIGISLEAGYGRLIPKNVYKNTDYRIEGLYATAGFNYLYEYDPGTRLYLGARYAKSMFSDRGDFTVQSPLWNDYTGTFERKNLNADWAEFIIGSEATWKGNLYLGFIFRFRIMIDYPRFNDIDLYTVPGYGRAADKSTPAVNVYVKYLFLHKMPTAK